MIYRKYQFENKEAFELALEQYGPEAVSVAAPGVLTVHEAQVDSEGTVLFPPVFTEGFMADIIWKQAAPEALEHAAVWPQPGEELHSIAGMQPLYVESYALKHF